MKKLLIISAITLMISGCGIRTKEVRAYIVSIADEGNWLTQGRIECNSFTMVSPNECVLFVDGRRQVIFGELIKVSSTGVK